MKKKKLIKIKHHQALRELTDINYIYERIKNIKVGYKTNCYTSMLKLVAKMFLRNIGTYSVGVQVSLPLKSLKRINVIGLNLL